MTVLHCCSDNVAPPADVSHFQDVTHLNYSPSICNLKHDLKKNQIVVYLGPTGYQGHSMNFKLHTYAIVEKVSPDHVPNVLESPLPWCKI